MGGMSADYDYPVFNYTNLLDVKNAVKKTKPKSEKIYGSRNAIKRF
jgi:hypothetical protein